MKEKKENLETSLSTAAAIKLGTRPSPPPHPTTYVLESQHRLTQLTQHETHESKTRCTLLYAEYPMDDISQMDKKIRKLGNFTLDGSSHQTGDAAFTPPSPRTYSTREPTPVHTTHTTRNTRE